MRNVAVLNTDAEPGPLFKDGVAFWESDPDEWGEFIRLDRARDGWFITHADMEAHDGASLSTLVSKDDLMALARIIVTSLEAPFDRAELFWDKENSYEVPH